MQSGRKWDGDGGDIDLNQKPTDASRRRRRAEVGQTFLWFYFVLLSVFMQLLLSHYFLCFSLYALLPVVIHRLVLPGTNPDLEPLLEDKPVIDELPLVGGFKGDLLVSSGRTRATSPLVLTSYLANSVGISL